MPQRTRNGGWDQPIIGEALMDTVLEMIDIYVTHIQNTVAQYVSTQIISDITVEEEWMPLLTELLHWQQQVEAEGNDLELG